MSKFRIKIPPEVKAAVRAQQSNQKPSTPPPPVKPKCWKQLGTMSAFHAHLADGTCVLKNWSNREIWTSATGVTWLGPNTGNRRLGDPTGAKKRRNDEG